MGKLIRIRVLWGGAGLCKVPRGEDGTRKFFLSRRVGRKWGKTKPCGAGPKTPSFGPALPHCHPYLQHCHNYLSLDNYKHFNLPNGSFFVYILLNRAHTQLLSNKSEYFDS